MDSKKAVLLLSGGLDSATTLAMAKSEGFEVFALSFAYGQRHKHELKMAKRVADHYSVTHRVITIDLGGFGTSALTDRALDVPKGRTLDEMATGIPITYVPARNTVFLSFALAWAEAIKAYDIFIGVNAVDYSGYPDCRPEFIKAFEDMANLATAYGLPPHVPPASGGDKRGGKRIRIHAPLIKLRKSEIIARGLALGVDYSLTSSCYDPTPTGIACGQCDSCELRRKGFSENGSKDPIRYAP